MCISVRIGTLRVIWRSLSYGVKEVLQAFHLVLTVLPRTVDCIDSPVRWWLFWRARSGAWRRRSATRLGWLGSRGVGSTAVVSHAAAITDDYHSAVNCRIPNLRFAPKLYQ